MKKRIIAATLMLAMFATTAYAANTYKKTIEVEYGIGLSINGKTPALTDAAGNAVQPFTYNGTTYVPIRAVGENMGATVRYDAASNTASVTASMSTSEKRLYSMNTLLTATQLSHKIHNQADYMNLWIAKDMPDTTAESFDAIRGYIQEDLKNLQYSLRMETSENFKEITSLLSEQNDAYLQALTSFFNYKTGKQNDGTSCLDSLKTEYDKWTKVQKLIDAESSLIINDQLDETSPFKS